MTLIEWKIKQLRRILPGKLQQFEQWHYVYSYKGKYWAHQSQFFQSPSEYTLKCIREGMRTKEEILNGPQTKIGIYEHYWIRYFKMIE